MFGWFKKKKQPLGTMLESQSLAIAIAEIVNEYFSAVEAGTISMPAYKRKNANIEEVWVDTRIEIFRFMFVGVSDLLLLSETQRQMEILDYFFNNKPIVKLINEPINDTLYCIYKLYGYIEAIGIEVGDVTIVELRNKTIMDKFNASLKKAHDEWSQFEVAVKGTGSLPPLPDTIFNILYKDITLKSKTIAFSAVLGPYYVNMFRTLQERSKDSLRAKGYPEKLISEEMQVNNREFEKLLALDDPDHLHKD